MKKKDEQMDKLLPLIGNNNNNNNNQVNINVFLNEECKDALNIKDFVEFTSITIKRFRKYRKIRICGRHK